MQAQQLSEEVESGISCPTTGCMGCSGSEFLLEPAAKAVNREEDVGEKGMLFSWDAEMIPCHQKKSLFIEELLRKETGT